jgi:16S rRNA (cytosine967-C5)-methyltransferase
MIPGARIAAAIEILDAIAADSRPADRALDAYLRQRRYIGGGDRKTITDRVYGIIRRRARLGWWVQHRDAELEATGRNLLLCDMALIEQTAVDELDRLFSGGGHSPAPLETAEREFYRSCLGQPLVHDDMPEEVTLECPAGLAVQLRASLGDDFEAEMLAAQKEAPFDLRINPLNRPERRRVRQELEHVGLETESTPLSPIGLRAASRKPVNRFKAFQSGRIEVQDEGAQIAAMLVGAQPGMQVADFCAGAGGKSLVMAGAMRNKGRVMALDTSEGRLKRTADRASRAGLHNIERRHIKDERDRKLKRMAGKFDRVLVDAPCTGTGTWRRNPDARWRYGTEDLAEIVDLQSRILASSARLVKPGGRLIYVTCSLLIEENEARIESFLETTPDFQVVPIDRVWRETLSQLGAPDCPTADPLLRLTPGRHGTDGFFVAVLEREAAIEAPIEEGEEVPTSEEGPAPEEVTGSEEGSAPEQD